MPTAAAAPGSATGAAGPVGEASTSTLTAAVDDALSKLEFANIAFNAPASINLEDSARIQLLLALATSIDDLKKQIDAGGDLRGARIKVADRMQAHLTGANFDISAITPEDQAISGRDSTQWQWDVKPKSDGVQHLHLTLSALIEVDGQSTPRSIRTFDSDIRVVVPVRHELLSFFKDNWQWLWATLLVPFGAWLWGKWKKARAPAPTKPESPEDG